METEVPVALGQQAEQRGPLALPQGALPGHQVDEREAAAAHPADVGVVQQLQRLQSIGALLGEADGMDLALGQAVAQVAAHVQHMDARHPLPRQRREHGVELVGLPRPRRTRQQHVAVDRGLAVPEHRLAVGQPMAERDPQMRRGMHVPAPCRRLRCIGVGGQPAHLVHGTAAGAPAPLGVLAWRAVGRRTWMA